MRNRFICIALALLAWLLVGATILAQDSASAETETLIGRIVGIEDSGALDVGDGQTIHYQILAVTIERGALAGETITTERNAFSLWLGEQGYAIGDQVYVDRTLGPDGNRFYVTGPVRTAALWRIAAIFAAAVLLIGWLKGLRSLLGAAVSLLVLFGFVVPEILAGVNPLLVCISGAALILITSTYIIQGINAKAHAAVLGMTISLAITGLLATWFVAWTHLSGLGDESVTYLALELGTQLDLRGLLLGGIIIGALGVLDDICVGQASAAFELARATPGAAWVELFWGALRIGQDHIAAAVNTLLLAYAGSSLPLLLLFALYDLPLAQRLDMAMVSEEVVRTLAGSIGLVLAVPITALIASVFARRERG